MKVIRFHQHGGPEVLRYEQVPDPQPSEGEVILQVKAASVNHLDLWLRRGIPGIEIPLPRVPGADAAGVIMEVGPGVKNISPGQRVLIDPGLGFCKVCEHCLDGNTSLCPRYEILGEHRDGSYTEYLRIPADNIVQLPETMSFEDAAAIPLVFLTAWRMLVRRGRLKAGEDILILGAGAGVGTACIQIARLFGARVIAAASSEEKLEKSRQIGADITINYSREDLPKRVREITQKRGVDIVVDYIGAHTWLKSILCLRRGGRLLTCGATTGYDPKEDIRHIFYRQLEIIGSTMGSRKDLLDPLSLVIAGKLRPVIDRVLPLKEAPEAHRLIEARSTFGKIVLRPE
jgi:NADPH:quinone reductase-like Zn-dependent oxidoreductase